MPDGITKLTPVGDEPRLLCGTAAGRVFEFPAGSPAQILSYRGLDGSAIRSLDISADGGVVIGSNREGRLIAWDRATRKSVNELTARRPMIQAAVLGPQSYLLLDDRWTAYTWRPSESAVTGWEPITATSGEALTVGEFGVASGAERVVLLYEFEWYVWDPATRRIVETRMPEDPMYLANPSGRTGLSRNGRFFYVYWDKYLVFDTMSAEQIRREDSIMDPSACALSDDGQVLVLGDPDGGVVVVGPDGSAVFDEVLSSEKIVDVQIAPAGALATFVDAGGEAGCVDVAGRKVLIDRERMRAIAELE